MRKILCLALSVCVCFCALAFNSQITKGDATEDFSLPANVFVGKIGIGWNLGNTLDAHPTWGMGSNPTPYEQETGWKNPYTSTDMIDLIKDSGFNSIRIPVTWYPQVSVKDGVYTINSAWMNRVKKIAQYCVDKDMYVIVDMHHDDRKWLNISAKETTWQKVKEEYTQLWTQIATAFKDFDEHLILEGANEIVPTSNFCPKDYSSTHEFKYTDGDYVTGGLCWWGLHNPKAQERINEIYKIFCNVVRASGGNNDKRYLMLPTLGAQCGNSSYFEKIYKPANDDHIIVDIHWYTLGDQIDNDKRANYTAIWQQQMNKYGFAIVMGECGFYEDVASQTKVLWASRFVKDLRDNFNIPVFLWDDGGDMKIMNRSAASWVTKTADNTAYVQAAVEAGKVDENFVFTTKPPKPVLGDVDGNFKLELRDALVVKNYLAKKSVPADCTVSVSTADMNYDKVINAVDLLIIRRKIVNSFS